MPTLHTGTGMAVVGINGTFRDYPSSPGCPDSPPCVADLCSPLRRGDGPGTGLKSIQSPAMRTPWARLERPTNWKREAMNRITVLAVAGLTVALAGTGLAAADAVTSTPTYHGCVVGTSRTLERVYTSKTPTCPTGSFAANWNQTGPRGAPGVTTAGPGGLDVIEVSNTTGPGTSVAVVGCPSDHPYVLGGGGVAGGVGNSIIVSAPDADSPATSWEIQGTSTTGTYTVYAICAK
jgi:hypothetical protein